MGLDSQGLIKSSIQSGYKFYKCDRLFEVMPNVLDVPMKRTENITISEESAYAVLSARRARIEINSTMNKGIQINSSHKSEQVSIGINDYYLASVTYRKRTYPIYLIMSFIVGFFGIGSIFIGGGPLEILISIFLSMVLLFIYFYTRMARLSFRLADEQDYDILLESSAVSDSQLMQLFIQKVLMNSLKVEGFVSDVKPSEKPIQSGFQTSTPNQMPQQQMPQPLPPQQQMPQPLPPQQQIPQQQMYQFNQQ
jgi:hypothetical protein